MLKITISNDIRLPLNEISSELMKAIKSDLTMDNPEYTQAVKYGYSVFGKEKHLHLYQVDREEFVLPRGYGPDLSQRLQEYHIKVQWDDQRLILPTVEFGSRITLRDYQVPAVEALVKKRQGGVVAGCGSGKTQILLEAIARIKQPTLWICHTHELLNQTKKRALAVLDIDESDIGEIAGGKVSIGSKLTLCLVQTLSKIDISELVGKFGAICIDEAHHMAARTFYHPIGQFPALYRLWASATPERADGLTKMVYASGGPIVHSIDQDDLPTLTPTLNVVETDFSYHSEDYPELISSLVQNKQRNDLIINTIIQVAEGHFSLVLSDRKEHLNTLGKLLAEAAPKLRIEILTGSLSKGSRVKIMERLQRREVDVLLATQLAREGLDVIHLDRLFLVTPKKSPGTIQQELGRVMRPCEGKQTPLVYDFWDTKSPILKTQFWRRREVYEKLGIQWKKPVKKIIA